MWTKFSIDFVYSFLETGSINKKKKKTAACSCILQIWMRQRGGHKAAISFNLDFIGRKDLHSFTYFFFKMVINCTTFSLTQNYEIWICIFKFQDQEFIIIAYLTTLIACGGWGCLLKLCRHFDYSYIPVQVKTHNRHNVELVPVHFSSFGEKKVQIKKNLLQRVRRQKTWCYWKVFHHKILESMKLFSRKSNFSKESWNQTWFSMENISTL